MGIEDKKIEANDCPKNGNKSWKAYNPNDEREQGATSEFFEDASEKNVINHKIVQAYELEGFRANQANTNAQNADAQNAKAARLQTNEQDYAARLAAERQYQAALNAQTIQHQANLNAQLAQHQASLNEIQLQKAREQGNISLQMQLASGETQQIIGDEKVLTTNELALASALKSLTPEKLQAVIAMAQK